MNSDEGLGSLATMLTATAKSINTSDEQLKEDDMHTIFTTKNQSVVQLLWTYLTSHAWTGRNDDQPRQSIVEPSPREIHEEHDESSLPGAIVGISLAQTIVLLLITFNSIHYWVKGGQSTSHSCFLFNHFPLFRVRCCPAEGEDHIARRPCDDHICPNERWFHLPILATLPPPDPHHLASWPRILLLHHP